MTRSTALTAGGEEEAVKRQFVEAETRLREIQGLISSENARVRQEESDAAAFEARNNEVFVCFFVPDLVW